MNTLSIANISFEFIDDPDTLAHIRVTFSAPEAWSAIGRDAMAILAGAPTMCLGFIQEDHSSGESHAMALHQIGHALGLDHEWNGQKIHSLEDESNKAITQHVQRLSGKCASNFPYVDNKSIMSYFIPQEITQASESDDMVEGTTNDLRVLELSESDKAWLTINYPGRSATVSGVKWTLLHALHTLDMPLYAGSRIISSEGDEEQRAHYAEHISSTWQRTAAVDYTKIFTDPPVSVISGLHLLANEGEQKEPERKKETPDEDRLAALILHPAFVEATEKMFEANIKKTILDDYPKKGFSTTTDSSLEVQHGIIGILLPTLIPLITELAGKAMRSHGVPNVGHYPGQPLAPEVQQGIFNSMTKFIKNPAFPNSIKEFIMKIAREVAKEVLKEEKEKNK
ncbi:hypothetical protein VNI00_015785 [Paramarasmius palmivorus]|uniref:Peptidase M10 metallopeptidase domain-containing protein n=1 Tax=Paramarasmius palmivorus TaxID=297713 RepID=A0AAW0BHZ6_9AGAR